MCVGSSSRAQYAPQRHIFSWSLCCFLFLSFFPRQYRSMQSHPPIKREKKSSLIVRHVILALFMSKRNRFAVFIAWTHENRIRGEHGGASHTSFTNEELNFRRICRNDVTSSLRVLMANHRNRWGPQRFLLRFSTRISFALTFFCTQHPCSVTLNSLCTSGRSRPSLLGLQVLAGQYKNKIGFEADVDLDRYRRIYTSGAADNKEANRY